MTTPRGESDDGGVLFELRNILVAIPWAAQFGFLVDVGLVTCTEEPGIFVILFGSSLRDVVTIVMSGLGYFIVKSFNSLATALHDFSFGLENCTFREVLLLIPGPLTAQALLRQTPLQLDWAFVSCP